jgi:hypothetical protein
MFANWGTQIFEYLWEFKDLYFFLKYGTIYRYQYSGSIIVKYVWRGIIFRKFLTT